MRCVVAIALAVLSLTVRLPTGHTQGQSDSQGSETTEKLPVIAELLDSSDQWNVSQPSLSEEDGPPETLEEGNATSLIRDGVLATFQTVTPDVVFDQIITEVDPQEDTITTLQVDIITSTRQDDVFITTQENIITPPHEEIITTFQEDITARHQDNGSITSRENIITTSQEDIITTPQEDITTHHENITTHHENITTHHENITTHQENITTHQENITTHQENITTPQEDITTHQENITIHEEDIIINTSQEDITTHQENITTHQEDIIITTSQEDITTPPKAPPTAQETTRTTVTEAVLEDGKVPTLPDQLVVCSCPEPTTADGCRRFLSDATIDSKDIDFEDIRRSVSDLNVVVHNMSCHKKDHRFMMFKEGHFYHRERGDVVLVNAGYLTGLRVNDYCADLRLDEYGYMTWNMKICIAPPSVPRCCPYGHALKDGECQKANTPALLEPPLAAGLKEKPIYWPVIKNHYHPLNCTKDPLLSIPLVPHESYLLSVPTGIMHMWHPADRHVQRHYTYAPHLCVDGYVDSWGSVLYSAHICYSHPEELYRRVCSGRTCVRKCCPDDQEMSLLLYRCVPSNLTNFKPRFTVPPSEYRIVNGKPICPFQTVLDDATIDSRGRFHFNGDVLSAREYCVDKFKDGQGNIEDKTLVCIKEPTKPWLKIRDVAFPICQMISVFFLILTVGCYCLVPVLLKGGGWYQLFHVISLMMAYVFMFTQSMFSKIVEKDICFVLGIMLQFSFLSTFFWLNVLCFEVWRKIRSLNKFRPASSISIWIYLLYGFGMPLAIGILTVCMHFFAPSDVPGVVKPNLAQSRCFFPDPIGLLLYFYGPIGFLFILNIGFITHTYLTYRTFEKNSSKLREASAENSCATKIPMEQMHRKRDCISDFKQQFSLLVLMSSCWVFELLSWFIPPIELWALTDTLNTAQGFFLFVIFMANRSKRRHLKKKFPLIFKCAGQIGSAIRQCCCCCCHRGNDSCLAPLGSFTSQVSRKLSSSSLVSNLSTLTTSLKFSRSSFSVSIPDDLDTKTPSSVLEPDGGIIILSHSLLAIKNVSDHKNLDTHC